VDPRAADARHNLRSLGADRALAAVRPLDRLSASERALLAAGGWWLLTIGLAVAVLYGGRRIAPASGAALLLIAGIGAAIQATRPALVTPRGERALLYAAPTTRDAMLGELPAGTVARLAEEREGWVRIRTRSGTEAWVERDAVARL